MRLSRTSILTGCLSVLALVTVASPPVRGCPFCSAPSLTLSEQVAQADVVALVSWVGGQAAKISDSGSTEFQVIEVLQQPAGGKLAKGGKINMIRYRTGKPGDQFMLFGQVIESAIEWSSPLEISKGGFEYIRSLPKTTEPAVERLKYFVQFLETSDKFIADDSFGEIANAAYADVAKVVVELPREKIRGWLNSNEVAPGRMGLYGMMLGLRGDADDAKMLESKIMEKTEEFRLGIDGIMGGYLLLTKDEGLEKLETNKFKNKNAPFSETYAAMQAVRFMWTYGDGRISNDRLRESMRLLLDRPELADLVITDLSRMKDWSVQDKLMTLFDDPDNIPSVKRAIVRYMLSSVRDTGEKKTEITTTGNAGGASVTEEREVAELPAHVVKGQKCLEELERKDPKTVTEAKRFFLPK